MNHHMLFLVRPEEQPTPDANVQAIANYLAAILQVPEAKEFTSSLTASNNDNPVEMWYWFDNLNLCHNVAFWGDNIEHVDDIRRPDYQVSEDPYFWYPFFLFYLFPAVSYDFPLTTQIPLDARDTLSAWFDLFRHPESLWGLAKGAQDKDALHEFASDITADTAAKEWRSTVLFAQYANRMNLVPVPKAAALLGVTERTVRNNCGKTLECIRWRGTRWVTKHSISKFIADNYQPTATFNLWDTVEEALATETRKIR
jgi:hypothetical protein